MRKNWNSLRPAPGVRSPAPRRSAGVCLQVRTMTPEEAELGAAQDRARAAHQPDGGHGLHPGHRPQPPGALGGPGPRRPGEATSRRSSTTSSGARSTPPASSDRKQGRSKYGAKATAGRREAASHAAPSVDPAQGQVPAERRTASPTASRAKLMRDGKRDAVRPDPPPGARPRRVPRQAPGPRGPGGGRCATRPRSSRSSPAASAAPPTRSRSRSAATAACRSACAGSSRPPASAAARA